MGLYTDIINGINGTLKDVIKEYVSGGTETINLFGLSNSYRLEDGSSAPMVNNNGELTYIYDLDYPITGYHRLNESGFKSVKGFGSKVELKASNSLAFVIIGKRENLTTDPETLALVVGTHLPGIKIEMPSGRGAIQTISFNTDPSTILKSEFSNTAATTKYNDPDYFFIKINYLCVLDVVANCLTCK